MNKISLLIAVIFTVNIAFGQTDSTKKEADNFHTIFGNSGEKTKVSGFGALMMDFGSIENNFGLNMGLDGAVLINRSFFMGELWLRLQHTHIQHSVIKKRSLS